MAIIDLQEGALSARISTSGGLLLHYSWMRDGLTIPLLRPAADDADPLSSACYPLVPFGNRVRGNHFTFEGRDYSLKPNRDWDEHYLHGDGWLAEWDVLSKSGSTARIGFRHRADGTPYSYEAEQSFVLTVEGLELSMRVQNTGEESLPFGLGWHPFFPLTEETSLLAKAERFWTETEGWLPGEPAEIPAELDFSRPAPLPQRWINNGFENWSGTARIVWPERSTALQLTTDPIFRHAVLFLSDERFDPGFHRDYFCFEPMTHLANGHNLPDLGDLTILPPGESLAGSIRLQPQDIALSSRA
jgi:aldose 1-epimerase